MQRLFAAFVSASLLLVMMAPTVMAKPDTTRVAICHYSKATNSYALQLVRPNTVTKHRAHGDALPGEAVPTMPGYVFDAGCTAQPLDADQDTVPDANDNCPMAPNTDQSDRYGSPKGDACEDDSDGDGTLDTDEVNICVSIDGVFIVEGRGGAYCGTAPSTGSHPNIAVAHDSGAAQAVSGDNNTAIADGYAAVAAASYGNNNTATASGVQAQARAIYGDNNVAIANGDGTRALANAPEGCTAEATVASPSATCP